MPNSLGSLGDDRFPGGMAYSLGNLVWGCQIPWGAKFPVIPDPRWFASAIAREGTLTNSEPRGSSSRVGFMYHTRAIINTWKCRVLAVNFCVEKFSPRLIFVTRDIDVNFPIYGICPQEYIVTQEWYTCRVSKYVEAQRVLQHSVAVSEADVDASKPITAKNTEVAFSVQFFAVLASTSASETATKVQLFVAVSEADVDASKKPITVQNTEVAFSAFFTVMGLLLASTSASETATNAALPALSFATSSKSESLSQ